MFQHQRGGPKRADRIGNPLPGDVERRAVNGFEHRRKAPLRIHVGGGRDPQTAGQSRGQVGQDIRVQIGGYNRVEAGGFPYHTRGHGIDQHFVARDLGKASMRASSQAGILTLGVLAHDHPVQVALLAAAQRRRYTGQDFRRPKICILVEALANRQTQPPERHVVRDAGRAHGAEVDRIKSPQPVQCVGRHHRAVFSVVVGAPRKLFYLQAKAARSLLKCLQSLKPRRYDLRPDAVTGDCRNHVLSHVKTPPPNERAPKVFLLRKSFHKNEASEVKPTYTKSAASRREPLLGVRGSSTLSASSPASFLLMAVSAGFFAILCIAHFGLRRQEMAHVRPPVSELQQIEAKCFLKTLSRTSPNAPGAVLRAVSCPFYCSSTLLRFWIE